MIVYTIQYACCEFNTDESFQEGQEIYASLESLKDALDKYMLDMFIGLPEEYDDYDPNIKFNNYSDFYEYYKNHSENKELGFEYIKPYSLDDLEMLDMKPGIMYYIANWDSDIHAIGCHRLVD